MRQGPMSMSGEGDGNLLSPISDAALSVQQKCRTAVCAGRPAFIDVAAKSKN